MRNRSRKLCIGRKSAAPSRQQATWETAALRIRGRACWQPEAPHLVPAAREALRRPRSYFADCPRGKAGGVADWSSWTGRPMQQGAQAAEHTATWHSADGDCRGEREAELATRSGYNFADSEPADVVCLPWTPEANQSRQKPV